MIKLYSPQSEVDLALIRSVLEAEGIYFFVHNDHFGSLRIGPSIKLYNTRTIMVNVEDFSRASELVADYLKSTNKEDMESAKGTFQSEYSLLDKIRVIFETIFFGWTVPGKSKKHRPSEKD